jgi:hypothetical protein
VCRFHVAAGEKLHADKFPGAIVRSVAKLAGIDLRKCGSFSYWFEKPWFHNWGKLAAMLIITFSWSFPTSFLVSTTHQRNNNHPSTYKFPLSRKPYNPETSIHETYCKPPPSSTRDREGPEALPGILPERVVITEPTSRVMREYPPLAHGSITVSRWLSSPRCASC